MLKTITQSQIFVLDQDEALDFYVNKLGLELNTDTDLGFMRWLTVNVPGSSSPRSRLNVRTASISVCVTRSETPSESAR